MAPKKRRKHPQYHANFPPGMQGEIEALFNKRIVLKSREETWANLPKSSCMFQEEPFVLADMILMKDELNTKKSLLNDMDIVEWHSHTRRVHKAGLVVRHLREKLHVEMCTQAWAKFHEILHSFNLIPDDALHTGSFRSVHLCEAPGAFVACLNHLLKSEYHGLEWNWIASTLNPYYEGHDLRAMLDDDRFISETLSHWHFGSDGTGDLMSVANLEALQHDAAFVHLVTADGSINCANQPDEQESVVGQLIFCEAVTAINLLSKGGNFVFKMFTALEQQMICLLFLLTCLFQEIQVIKPGTSKSGNSEIYVVCLGFIGKEEIPKEIIEILRKEYGSKCPATGLFSLSSIPLTFLEKLRACETFFTRMQMEAIDNHIQQFHFMSEAERKAHRQLQKLVVNSFLEKFPLQPIKREYRIVPGVILDGTQSSTVRGPTNGVHFDESFNGHHQKGSYNQRQNNLHQEWIEKILEDGMFKLDSTQCSSLQGLSRSSNGISLIPLYHDEVVWLSRMETTKDASYIKLWKPQTAARLDGVLNSRFCTPLYVSKIREAQKQATILKKENSDKLEEILDKVSPPRIVLRSKGGQGKLKNLDNLVSFSDVVRNGNIGVLLNITKGLGYLMSYLQEQGAQFRSIHVTVSNESKKTLVYFNQEMLCELRDISENVKQLFGNSDLRRCQLVFADADKGDELSTEMEMLLLCVTALKLLDTGGMFVCHICETLTRFSVGILYMLHQLFEEITILKPVMSELSSPQRFLVCKRFKGKDSYQDYLSSVLDEHIHCKSLPIDVVESVPINLLQSEKFYHFVKCTNEQLAHLELRSIFQLERLFLYPELIPSSKDITNLKNELMDYIK
ncbi:Cap-specific mRNA (nucleoside-2'-O-)-methyltransferase 2 [Acropora cervicornis]|uniref:Cap-specific mRNA (nucleoside-2'-O-)-methyltransferase 2 n=1 Tax=Acropora cervicornis TaxID=6130 RepID=A0AAD9Q694_ACRCE|nr:Cap-specific mRNA (nucleoside-2'-O-)-methyltransferase 2 [Acropora cervicornis]